ncbi:NAD(P)/FAD-dependent oxidoreductase [Pseudonocardia spinosispora]|uniref:NAD(P)/FAD-dependent oxidoreductase n=1 Tax=Pseudonocardia spinosispora TaxID=103441 RepID=UPI0004097CF1|nr:FAD-dependent oxidoreductase [Pseudonocardia spinosispora]
MAESDGTIVLVGGGAAASAAAIELRKQDFEGRVTVLTRELDPPYHRPAVSKELLGPGAAEADIWWPPRDWWADHDVDLRTRASVTSLDVGARTVALADRSALSFDAALLATGANVRRLNLPGSGLAGIHYLRAPGNAHKLRAETQRARRAVLVGGSFIAAEVAAQLTVAGVEATMVMPERAPMQTTFGTAVADHIAALLVENGVRLVCGEQVAEFSGTGGVEEVRTDAGTVLPADLVVVGVGATPDTRLAAKAGLELGATGGIACDATLRTSAEGVFAAGDVCEYFSEVHGRRLRVEHHEHAVAQGVTAARGLMGAPEPHREVPYFWTELADWALLEYVGPAGEWDTERITGSLSDGEFTVWYERAGSVVAALTRGRPDDLDRARELIAG